MFSVLVAITENQLLLSNPFTNIYIFTISNKTELRVCMCVCVRFGGEGVEWSFIKTVEKSIYYLLFNEYF